MITLEEGKYMIIIDSARGVFKCMRYGQNWRDLTGDKMILALCDKIEDMKTENSKLYAKIGEMCVHSAGLIDERSALKKKIEEMESIVPISWVKINEDGEPTFTQIANRDWPDWARKFLPEEKGQMSTCDTCLESQLCDAYDPTNHGMCGGWKQK